MGPEAGPAGTRRPPGSVAHLARLATALVTLALGLLASSPAARAQDPSGDPPALEILDQRPAEGQQCIVCRLRIHDGDIVEVRYKGRTFFVAAKMLDRLEADPDAYFVALQAHSGLFDETAMEMPPLRTGWLLFGLWVLTGLLAGAACSYLALGRGLPAWGWFFAGLLANVLALAAVLAMRRRADPPTEGVPTGLGKIPTTRSPVACGNCGGTNHPAAAVCSACGHSLSPTVEPETARA